MDQLAARRTERQARAERARQEDVIGLISGLTGRPMALRQASDGSTQVLIAHRLPPVPPSKRLRAVATP